MFSVCLIARNESKTLPRLVKSLSEFTKRGGEIIVVDTGSTDNTASVAKSLGCEVHEVGNKFLKTISATVASQINDKYIVNNEGVVVKEGDTLFDFASARNYCASLAKTDWVAMPDCDEIYTKLDLDKIEEAMKVSDQLEYEFVFAHDEQGRATLQFIHSKFYNKKKLKRVGIIHEVLMGDATRKYLGEDIIKLEHYQNVETNRKGYLKGLALDTFENPDNDRNSHYFAREMMYEGMYKSAIKEFERHIAMNRRVAEKAQSMMYMGDCYLYSGDEEMALHRYRKARETDSNRREPLLSLAQVYKSKNMRQQVVTYCIGALEIKNPTNFYSNRMENYREKPHELLYLAYRYLGDKQKSKEHFESAYSYAPEKYENDKQFYN